ncbi:DUF2306 domain-containing protein [Emticicia sp. CRIBPO]|uniref:DUF2306 domain-containing protein n=1 Tax=Emticicia sp. CRIBPO TaxID=2683258 RepID=UPI001411EA23|nr:DUF2306 domain-containing protein [Emticicia sp. CRIBPO]NBA87374.1 DUF2306 domain-containing protein [Emticicia sp. CRIBPO]
METNVLTSDKSLTYSPKLLDFTARFWFITATIGQWIFGGYIIAVYYTSTFTGDFARWNKVLPKGYVEGDWKGNLMVGVHVILAAIIVIGGPLQLIPRIRDRFRTFHRWLGRTYLVTAVIVSLVGFVMVWTRGTVGDTFMYISNSVQAIYILVFAVLAIRYAQKRQFDKHRRWTLRLFMVANGVWFFRVGLMAWLVVNQAPVGFDPETFTGPFLTVLSLFSYGLPLSVILLEMYFYAQKIQNQTFTYMTSAVILLFTLIMALGIFGATMGMWLPRM